VIASRPCGNAATPPRPFDPVAFNVMTSPLQSRDQTGRPACHHHRPREHRAVARAEPSITGNARSCRRCRSPWRAGAGGSKRGRAQLQRPGSRGSGVGRAPARVESSRARPEPFVKTGWIWATSSSVTCAGRLRRTPESGRLNATRTRGRVCRHGFHGVRGTRGRKRWYNFEALKHSTGAPRPLSLGTFYVDLGEPETVVLRTHTSPTQIHLMEEGVANDSLPIHSVMPDVATDAIRPIRATLRPSIRSRTGRRSRHHVRGLGGRDRDVHARLFRADIESRLRPGLLRSPNRRGVPVTCTIWSGRRLSKCSHPVG